MYKKGILSMPIPVGLNASDEANGSISRATPFRVGCFYHYDSSRTFVVAPTGVSFASGRIPHFTISGEAAVPLAAVGERSLT
jgi:hypothetical protein